MQHRRVTQNYAITSPILKYEFMFEIFAAMSIRIQVDITALLIAAIASPLIALPTTEVDKKSYIFGIKTYFSGTLYANLLQCRLVNGRKAHFDIVSAIWWLNGRLWNRLVDNLARKATILET